MLYVRFLPYRIQLPGTLVCTVSCYIIVCTAFPLLRTSNVVKTLLRTLYNDAVNYEFFLLPIQRRCSWVSTLLGYDTLWRGRSQTNVKLTDAVSSQDYTASRIDESNSSTDQGWKKGGEWKAEVLGGLQPYHIVHHKYRMNCPGIAPGLRGEEPAPLRELWHCYLVCS